MASFVIPFVKRIGATGINNVRTSSSPFMKFYTIKARNLSSPDDSDGKDDEEQRGERRIPNEKDEEVINSEILSTALKYVNTKGWTMEAIRAGAEEVYSAGEISEIFVEYDLVDYFIRSCNRELETHLANSPLNLQQALEYRLSMVTPYAKRFNEALSQATHPNNIPNSVSLLLRLADSIAHHSLKDVSTDLTWYSKRLGIASIYAASELCLVQDKSPNYTNTFDFMKRRVSDFEQFRMSSSPIPLPDILSAGFTTVLNILGRNAAR